MKRWIGSITTLLALVFVSALAPSNRAVKKTERLEGAAARQHIEKKIASRADWKAAHEKTVRELTERGFKPTDRFIVQRRYTQLSPLQRLVGLIVPTALADLYTYSNDEGEITQADWNDGDDSTYEGEVWMYHYGTSSWANAGWQLDITTAENTHVVWTSTGSSSSGAAAWRALLGYTQCAVAGCIGSAVACALSGPAWGPCAGAWCAGAQVGCAAGSVFYFIFEGNT
jgi:hypothetical protein